MGLFMKPLKKSEQRRINLINAARELFFTKGFTNTSIYDIAERVGVTQGLFYYYFETKEEIFDVILTTISENFVQQVDEILLMENVFLPIRIQHSINAFIKMESELKNAFIQDGKVSDHNHMHERIIHFSCERIIKTLTTILHQHFDSSSMTIQKAELMARFIVYGIIGMNKGGTEKLADDNHFVFINQMFDRVINLV